MIQLKNIAIGYKTPLLIANELELKNASIYALIGPNGKGKSTLLKTLTANIKPISGEIYVDQHNIHQLKINEISTLIAHIDAKFNGIENLNVFNYVALGRTPYLNFLGQIKPSDENYINEILQELNISHLANRFTNQISDGEKQLASVARALAQNTKVILLDEPTAHLDYKNKITLLKLLHKIAIEKQKCIVFSCHDLELCLQEKINIINIQNGNELSIFQGNSLNELIEQTFS